MNFNLQSQYYLPLSSGRAHRTEVFHLAVLLRRSKQLAIHDDIFKLKFFIVISIAFLESMNPGHFNTASGPVRNANEELRGRDCYKTVF